jgi:hypothetical protein
MSKLVHRDCEWLLYVNFIRQSREFCGNSRGNYGKPVREIL